MRRAVQALVLLQAVAGLRVDLHSGLSRRAAVGAAAAFAAPASNAASATDAASITDNIRDSLAKPGFKIEYEEFMDRDSGDIRSMPTGVKGDPLAGPVLLFGALATRFGGLVPDEMPFNIVQKFLRGILPKGAFPDYADDDFRKNFQDTWYGTNIQMTDKLPEFMRSRPSTWAPTMNNSTETESEQESVVAQDDASV